jgi:hypothetical protein
LRRASGAALIAGFALLPGGYAGAESSAAGVVTTLQGKATVARSEKVLPLAFRDDVFLKDRIDTEERSVVRVLLGGKALVTVRELSSLTVTETPGRAIVDLREGTVGLEVAKKLLSPGESIEVRTPNAIAAVRGSFIVVEVTLPDGKPSSRVITRDVSLPVSVSWEGGAADLVSNHTMLVSGSGASVTVTKPRPLNSKEIAQANAVRKGREPKHGDELAAGLHGGLEEEAEDAEKELEELLIAEEEGDDGTSTSELGLNELAATRRQGEVGSSSSALTPVGTVDRSSSAAGPTFGGSGPSGGGGAPPPPPVVPPPPPPVVSGGPGFSEFAGGNSSGSNASGNGIAPPARGRDGGPPPGLSKKQ